MKAIVLVSGGIDSAWLLGGALDEGCTPYAMTLDYGQRHDAELRAARAIGKQAHRHKFVQLDLTFAGSKLLKGREVAEVAHDVPPTYVPARNALFLSLALAWAETIKAQRIYIGANADDRAYPDCRRTFFDAFQKIARLGPLGFDVHVHAPFLQMRKHEVVRYGLDNGIDFARTVTCYDFGNDGACGVCDACTLRLAAFDYCGVADPATYR